MVWKSDGDDVRRKYDFTYDAVNRFMKGAFYAVVGVQISSLSFNVL